MTIYESMTILGNLICYMYSSANKSTNLISANKNRFCGKVALALKREKRTEWQFSIRIPVTHLVMRNKSVLELETEVYLVATFLVNVCLKKEKRFHDNYFNLQLLVLSLSFLQ